MKIVIERNNIFSKDLIFFFSSNFTRNQSFFNNFHSKDGLTDKNQSYFDNFHLNDNLTGKNQNLFDNFHSKDDLTDKNQSFFDNFLSYGPFDRQKSKFLQRTFLIVQ